jgi:hypothetical protein
VWLVLPYPMMMTACINLIFTESVFLYAGFSALETIILSSLGMALVLIDAISSLKSNIRPSRHIIPTKIQDPAQAIYESEDEATGKRLRK